MKRTWTESDLSILREEYPRQNIAATALRLGKTIAAIKTKAKLLGIKRDKESIGPWSRELTSRLKEIYTDALNPDIAKELDLTVSSIRAKAHVLGLKKSKEYYQKYPSKSQFKKGHVSHNKGKKMTEFCSPQQIENIKKAWFKKGHQPHNTKNDFDIVERVSKGKPYLWIRVSLGKWQLLQRYVWEKAYGKIEKGVNIQFKDGNTLNCTLENLYAIDRKKQMLVNSGPLNLTDKMVAKFLAGKYGDKAEFIYRPELIELKRNQLKLNRKIKEHGRKLQKTRRHDRRLLPS